MEKKLIHVIVMIIVALVVVAGVFYVLWTQEHQKYVKLDAFARCIKDKGAVFYGAFWCPHCQDQKALFSTFFESATSSLPYVECSTPDSKSQLQVCADQNIEVYPTWKFAGGVKQEGALSLQELADKTGCTAP